RDAYITEHVEIAAYALLEELAKRAGDLETARVARFIRDDEEEMARWIAARWDRFIDLSLAETGLEQRLSSWMREEGGYGSSRLAGRWTASRVRPTTRQYLAWAAGASVGGWLLLQLLGRLRTTKR